MVVTVTVVLFITVPIITNTVFCDDCSISDIDGGSFENGYVIEEW